MRQFGYLNKTSIRFDDTDSGAPIESIYDEKTFTAAIKNVQKFGGLNETGQMDEPTVKVSKPVYVLPEIKKFIKYLFVVNERSAMWNFR